MTITLTHRRCFSIYRNLHKLKIEVLNAVQLRSSYHALVCFGNSTEIEKVFGKMQDCTTSLFNLIDGENQRLSEEVSRLTQ